MAKFNHKKAAKQYLVDAGEFQTQNNMIGYNQAMAYHHDEMAEYYDGRIGDISNKDDYYTEQWEKHQKLHDQFFNEYQRLTKEAELGLTYWNGAHVKVTQWHIDNAIDSCKRCGNTTGYVLGGNLMVVAIYRQVPEEQGHYEIYVTRVESIGEVNQ